MQRPKQTHRCKVIVDFQYLALTPAFKKKTAVVVETFIVFDIASMDAEISMASDIASLHEPEKEMRIDSLITGVLES